MSKIKIVPHPMAAGAMAVRELICTGNNVTEMGHYSSSSPPSPALKRVKYPFTAG